MITIESSKRNQFIELPEKLSEISLDYLQTCAEEVIPMRGYAVIAQIGRCKLGDIVNNDSNAITTNNRIVYLKRSSKSYPEHEGRDEYLGNIVALSSTATYNSLYVDVQANELSPNIIRSFLSEDKTLTMAANKSNAFRGNSAAAASAILDLNKKQTAIQEVYKAHTEYIYTVALRIIAESDIMAFMNYKFESNLGEIVSKKHYINYLTSSTVLS